MHKKFNSNILLNFLCISKFKVKCKFNFGNLTTNELGPGITIIPEL